MGYKMIKIEELYEVYRLLSAGKSKSEISRIRNLDRKTVREYNRLFETCGITYNSTQIELTEFATKIESKLPTREKRKGKKEYLDKVKDKIEELLTSETDLRIDTCYRIIKSKYGLDVSYETFRRYVIKEGLITTKRKEFIRIELPAGEEIQIDYGKMGLLYDPLSKKQRVVYAFIGVLSYSRLPFVEFTYTQNQQSFVMSFVKMFGFYDGVTDYISIDNLKSGVIKADLYDPILNRTFSEMATHYGTVINPCRVKTPTDKGKVERLVPVVREQFKYLKNVNSSATVNELNRKIQDWCKNEYGARIHGTTREKPIQRFLEVEKEKLRVLPDNDFIVSVWKIAKVHPDQFIQFEKKCYSLPPEYRGKWVNVQKKGDFIRVFYDYKLIKEYKIPIGASTYDKNHFPEIKRMIMDGSYPKYLLNMSRKYGESVYEYIQFILESKSYMNVRRAIGCLTVIEEYKDSNFISSVCKQAKMRNVITPSQLKKMFECEKSQNILFSEIPRSLEGESMLREVSYYTT